MSSGGLTKRAVDNSADNAMSLSREIIVLDFGDEANNPYDKPEQDERFSSGNSELLNNNISILTPNHPCRDGLQAGRGVVAREE